MIDVDGLVAIDVHTHLHRSVHGETHSGGAEDMGEYFGIGAMPQYSLPELAEYYRERKMAAVVFGVDSISQSGEEPVPTNEEVAELAAGYLDVIIPFASIDPARGAAGVKAARRLITEHGRVALFHTGQTGVGAGQRAGGGIRLKYANPMHVDDVAVDFPDMPIILAHPSFPWQDEALSVATHKPQVYIDLSGWSPKYFPPQLVQYANSLLKHKVLFGSDFPVITPERWMKDFEAIAIKDEVRPLIMKENAAQPFGLRASGAGA
jgi:predicted TIM-barrel fold metal-dependent hydrolase